MTTRTRSPPDRRNAHQRRDVRGAERNGRVVAEDDVAAAEIEGARDPADIESQVREPRVERERAEAARRSRRRIRLVIRRDGAADRDHREHAERGDQREHRRKRRTAHWAPRRRAARHATHRLAPRTREIPVGGVDRSPAVPGFVERCRGRRDHSEQIRVGRQCREHLARGPCPIQMRAPVGDLEQCGPERSSNRFAVIPVLRGGERPAATRGPGHCPPSAAPP